MPFGEFLMMIGRVEKDDLIRALRLQRKRQTSLPDLAVELGMLEPEAISEVTDSIGKESGIDFIERAVGGRYLTVDQVLELKKVQTTTRPRIGEMLVELKIITGEMLRKSLGEFGEFRQLQSTSS